LLPDVFIYEKLYQVLFKNLISSFSKATTTCLSSLVDGCLSHDQITMFLTGFVKLEHLKMKKSMNHFSI